LAALELTQNEKNAQLDEAIKRD
jgi:outer membrane murein-binding lipoprotein Lpp